jgi:hypothetical protein
VQTNKVFQANLMKETLENTTATVVAESAGNYAGKSFKFTGVNKAGTSKGYQVYFIDNGVGTDPTIGTFESDSITWRADSSGDYASKYLTLNDGPSTAVVPYYLYFTVGGAGYDPKIGRPEVSSVTCVADVSRNLSGKYWTIRAGSDSSYYVWYKVTGGTDVDPAPGGTGIVVYIPQNATAQQVAYYTQQALAAQGRLYWSVPVPSAAILTIIAVMPYAETDAGAGNSGFTVSVTTQGVSAIGALSTKTLLKVVDIASGDTAATVGTKFVAAMNNYLGWTASGTSPSTLIHPTRGNTTDTADGNITGLTITPTQGVDPTTSTFESIPVVVNTADAANTIQAAIVAAINARCFDPINYPTKYTTQAGGTAPTLSITNIWPNITGVATANVDSPLTTFSRVKTGAAYVFADANMGAVASGLTFSIKPNVNEVIYLHEITMIGWIATIASGALWGTGTILTNGIYIEVVAKDGTQILKLTPTMKQNSDMMQLGFGSLSTIGLNVVYNLADAFGGEVPVNGCAGEYVRIVTNDSLAGITTQYWHLRGHYKDWT